MEPSNEKQKAWQEGLSFFNKKKLILLETGRIRNPSWKDSDGDSTNYFSRLDNISIIYSIDNDSENFSGFESSEEYCKKTLSQEQLSKIIFVNGHSVEKINELHDNFFDVVLLDSANDSQLIYEEFVSVISKIKEKSLIIIDDVTSPGFKGDKVLNFLDSIGIEYTKKIANPADCAYFFLNKESIELIKKNLVK
jgi:hypothetical protein